MTISPMVSRSVCKAGCAEPWGLGLVFDSVLARANNWFPDKAKHLLILFSFNEYSCCRITCLLQTVTFQRELKDQVESHFTWERIEICTILENIPFNSPVSGYLSPIVPLLPPYPSLQISISSNPQYEQWPNDPTTSFLPLPPPPPLSCEINKLTS